MFIEKSEDLFLGIPCKMLLSRMIPNNTLNLLFSKNDSG